MRPSVGAAYNLTLFRVSGKYTHVERYLGDPARQFRDSSLIEHSEAAFLQNINWSNCRSTVEKKATTGVPAENEELPDQVYTVYETSYQNDMVVALKCHYISQRVSAVCVGRSPNLTDLYERITEDRTVKFLDRVIISFVLMVVLLWYEFRR